MFFGKNRKIRSSNCPFLFSSGFRETLGKGLSFFADAAASIRGVVSRPVAAIFASFFYFRRAANEKKGVRTKLSGRLCGGL
jgi:hypothetical protein